MKNYIETAYHRPYKPRKGKLINTFRPKLFEGKSGVYLVRKGTDLVYIGHSASDIYKTMYRHFQSWNDPTQLRVVFDKNNPAYTVKIILTNPSEASKLEEYLILQNTPKYNTMVLDLLSPTQKREISRKFKARAKLSNNFNGILSSKKKGSYLEEVEKLGLPF